jgi:hypothetical protein
MLCCCSSAVCCQQVVYKFALLRPNIMLVPVFAFSLATGGMFTLLAWSIGFKWLLLGRQKPGVHAIWSLYYVRWWITRSTIKFTMSWIYILIRRTPMMVWYLRALGCKIGKNVAIDTPNIADWDLVEIGDDTGGSLSQLSMQKSLH